MGSLTTWREWLSLRESNARKRAVKAALNGTGTPLPGSYAACPSTNPKAMDSAKKTGVVKKQRLTAESERTPDYSFDRWVKMAQDLGDDVNALVGHAKDSDKKLDKEAEERSKKKDSKPEKNSEAEKPEENELSQNQNQDDEDQSSHGETWKQLRKIHKERSKDLDKNRSNNGSAKAATEPPKHS